MSEKNRNKLKKLQERKVELDKLEEEYMDGLHALREKEMATKEELRELETFEEEWFSVNSKIEGLKEYKYHEYSNIFPLMENEEFESFVADIEKYGLFEPITLFEGKILDGRNRYRACQKLGIPGKYRTLEKGISAFNYIISENLRRRHLTSAQLAEIALIIIEKKKEEIGGAGRPKIITFPKNEIKKESKPRDAYKETAEELHISRHTITKVKKIKEVAKKDPMIKEEWEKAKKGETSVDAVYKKAQVIEDISTLSTPYKHKIRAELEAEEKSIKQIKIEIQDVKDDKKRADIAKRNRAMEKKRAEREKLHLRIRDLNKNIHELENAFKSSGAKLDILSIESVDKIPKFKSKDPAYVLTNLSIYYETLDMKIYDTQLKELRAKYDILEKPLRDKLAVLEGEYKTKKDIIDKQKTDKNEESLWVEKQQELMSSEYEKQEIYEGSIKKFRKELKTLQKKYDDG